MFPGEYTKLERGCEVFMGGFSTKTMINEKEYIQKGIVNGVKSSIGELFDNMPKLIILGQPLTTLDILRMMETLGQDWILSTSGMLYESDMKRWQLNMSKNLFKDQPQETQEAIYKLLINEK